MRLMSFQYRWKEWVRAQSTIDWNDTSVNLVLQTVEYLDRFSAVSSILYVFCCDILWNQPVATVTFNILGPLGWLIFYIFFLYDLFDTLVRTWYFLLMSTNQKWIPENRCQTALTVHVNVHWEMVDLTRCFSLLNSWKTPSLIK